LEEAVAASAEAEVVAKFSYQGCDYNIIIIKKNNKNTYIKVDEDLNIVVTTSYFVSDNKILKLIKENEKSIIKMIKSRKLRQENNKVGTNEIKIFGKLYNIVYCNFQKKYEFKDNYILIKDGKSLDNLIKKIIIKEFNNHLNICYNNFYEQIPYPKLKFRKMKTRWGVCNYTKKIITLNTNLIFHEPKFLDYVIIHELSHLVYPNHSKDFWNLVEKYCNNYKIIKNELKKL